MAPAEDVRDVIVIGSGPAGLTAAIYAARANLSPLVLEGEPSSTSDQPAGQLMLTTDVENYPGFPAGIMGPMLMAGFREQAERFGAELQMVKASRVDLSGPPFGVWVGDPDTPEPTHRGKTVIVATGAQALMLNVPNEQRSSVTACRRAPPATASSSATRTSRSSAAVIPPSRRRTSSRSSPAA